MAVTWGECTLNTIMTHSQEKKMSKKLKRFILVSLFTSVKRNISVIGMVLLSNEAI